MSEKYRIEKYRILNGTLHLTAFGPNCVQLVVEIPGARDVGFWFHSEPEVDRLMTALTRKVVNLRPRFTHAERGMKLRFNGSGVTLHDPNDESSLQLRGNDQVHVPWSCFHTLLAQMLELKKETRHAREVVHPEHAHRPVPHAGHQLDGVLERRHARP